MSESFIPQVVVAAPLVEVCKPCVNQYIAPFVLLNAQSCTVPGMHPLNLWRFHITTTAVLVCRP